jgi:hypothetical protein
MKRNQNIEMFHNRAYQKQIVELTGNQTQNYYNSVWSEKRYSATHRRHQAHALLQLPFLSLTRGQRNQACSRTYCAHETINWAFKCPMYSICETTL